MKTLFEFKLIQNDKKSNGENEKKERYFALLKPSSILKQKAEVFLATTTSELVTAGVLTREMLRKRLLNDGGILSEKEKEDAQNLFKEYLELRDKLDKLIVIPEAERTQEQKDSFASITEELAVKIALINEFERSQEALFNNTAETLARNRHIFWWILNLIYEKKNDKYIELFNGTNFLAKQVQYDELVEDEFLNSLLFPILAELVTAWYLGKVINQEQFQKLFDNIYPSEQRETIVENKTEVINEKGS